MKLQTKIAAIPLLVVTALVVGLYYLLNQVIIDNFNSLEERNLHLQRLRVENSISTATDELGQKILDWSRWDETYQFIETLNPEYVSVNLNSSTLGSLGFSSAFYFSTDLELRYSAVVSADGVVAPADRQITEEIRSLMRSRQGQTGNGLVHLGGEIVMYAFAPILANDEAKPSRGTLLVTSILSVDSLNAVSHLTNLSAQYWRVGVDNIPNEMEDSLARLSKHHDEYIDRVSSNLAFVTGVVLDTYKKPAILFRIKDERVILNTGVNVRDSLLLWLSIVGILVAVLLYGIINYSAVRRLKSLTSSVTEIATLRDSSRRIIDLKNKRRALIWQTSGGVFAFFLLVTLSLSLAFNRYFLAGFEKVEDGATRADLVRAVRALESRLDKIQSKVSDWGQWDDTYGFMQDRNEAYIEANLAFLSLIKMSHVLYFDSKRNYFDGRQLAADRESVELVDTEVQTNVGNIPALSDVNYTGQRTSGFIKMSGRLSMASSSLILDTSRTGVPRGRIVFMAPVDRAVEEDLGKQVQLGLSILSNERDIPNELSIERRSDNQIFATMPVNDLLDNPSLAVRVVTERPIYQQGLLTAKLFPFYFILGGLLCAAVTMLCVYRFILSRFKRIAQSVSEVKSTGDLSLRLSKDGQDEISGLADHINSMLAALEIAQQELKVARDDAVAARAEAEAANAAKSAFIAKVSHELRTPIHSVMGMLRILWKEEPSEGKRSYIRMAQDSSEGLLTTINDILDFSKVESGNLSLETIPFSLREVVRDALRTVGPRAEEKGSVELLCDVPLEIPDFVLGDPLRIKQVLVNLLGNATKFTTSGFVKLSVKESRRNAEVTELSISVEDSGIGIPENRLATIFNPFEQADETVARLYQGTGLGLAIVKQLVEQMGGRVDVRSKEGVGTTFAFTLPLSVAPDRSVEENSARPPLRELVVVGRDSYTTKGLRTVAEQWGATVRIVAPEDITALNEIPKWKASLDGVVLTTEALQNETLYGVLKTIVDAGIKVVGVVSPFDIAPREKLLELSVTAVLTRPIVTEDVLLALWGQLVVREDGWANEEEALRQLSRKLRVLVADDAHTNRVILENMLEDAGHTVVSVANGLDLLSAIEPQVAGSYSASSYDIVITDIQMPLMDGLTATGKLRQLEKRYGSKVHVPVIAVTARAFESEQEEMKRAGIDAVVTKPVRPVDLAAALERLTSSPKSVATSASRPVVTTGGAQRGVDNAVTESLDSLIALVENTWREFGVESEGLIDIQDVYERSGRSKRRTKLILGAFLSSYTEQVKLLTHSGGDVRDLGHASHALKGLLLDIGAKAPASLADKMEGLCKEGRSSEAEELVERLVEQVSSVSRLVKCVEEKISV